jgi:hypothetical protein
MDEGGYRMVVSCRPLKASEGGVVWGFAEGRRRVTALSQCSVA